MPRVKKKSAKPKREVKTAAPLVERAEPKDDPAAVLMQRFMELHWGISAATRNRVIDNLVGVLDDEEVGADTKVAACRTFAEFDKINLGAAKLMMDGMLAAQTSRDASNGRDQLNEEQLGELVGALAASGPPEVVEDQEGSSDEAGPSVGEPSIFDEVARQMASRTAS